jgi:hypothetical protein
MKRDLLWALLAASSAMSCVRGDNTPIACAAYAVAGVSVDVTNAATAGPICDATVTITDGSYSERLLETSCRFVGAHERPGSYVVRAERTGFVSKEVGSVRVVTSGGDCPHVREVRLAMPLLPED